MALYLCKNWCAARQSASRLLIECGARAKPASIPARFGLTPRFRAATLFADEARNIFWTDVGEPLRDPASEAVSGVTLIGRLPKIWIGYLLAFATLIGEIIAVARNPELEKGVDIGALPLEIYLPTFVAVVYWLVCVHRYHVVLANVPGWKHPISPSRAVWFHFIPVYVIYWVFRWPAAIADFVNQRLRSPVMNKWTVGTMFFLSLLCRLFVDSALSVAMMFFACTYVSGFLQRALAAPAASQV
jgi:hypothetical protein